MKVALTAILVCFVVLCGLLVVESGLFEGVSAQESLRRASAGIRRAGRGCILLQQTTETGSQTGAAAEPNGQKLEAVKLVEFNAVGGPAKSVVLGSADPNSGFKYRLELTSQGAAIRRAIFSEFDNGEYKNPQPLLFLSPVHLGGSREILSMANRELVFVEQQRQLGLDRLSWKTPGCETSQDGSQTVVFESAVTDSADAPVVKLTKTYKIVPGSYLLECKLTIENLSGSQQKVQLNLAGPVGLGTEAFRDRQDSRKVVAGFRDSQGQIGSVRLDKKQLTRAKTLDERIPRLRKADDRVIWAAAVNKYFAAILVPEPDEGKDYCDWVTERSTIGWFYNPDADSKTDSGDETVGFDLALAPATLEPTGAAGNSRTYSFQLYLGPKDKSYFDKTELYKRLGFVQTIDFMVCCCPASIINPLAFAILAIMKWMYGFIGNYGIVIIILVFLMRLILHPITKKSQVSMSKMSKFAPMVEEIKKKYANNKAEMNKRLMEVYRRQGGTPIMSMLPMLVQMPIWIALWSAVYSSIDLRGAQFLPVWITDLSAPDAVVRFHAVTMPLFGWKIDSLNLLPILMGVAFYLQQKLTPSQAGASTNPQMAQQQKMMMIMMPLLFPLMLYTAPSGVNLYIMASTFAGVIEQQVIRKHIEKKEQQESQGLVAVTSKTGGKVKKKKPKPFFRV